MRIRAILFVGMVSACTAKQPLVSILYDPRLSLEAPQWMIVPSTALALTIEPEGNWSDEKQRVLRITITNRAERPFWLSTNQEPTGRVTTLAGVDLKVRTSAGEERNMSCHFMRVSVEKDGAALLKPGETWETTVVMGPCWLRESDEVIDVWVEYGGDLPPYMAPPGVEDFGGYRAQSDGMTIDVRTGKVLKRWRPPALRAKRHGE
jgi:hypothetical protein